MATRGIQTTALVVFLLISLIVRGDIDCTAPDVFNKENSKVIESTYKDEMTKRSYSLFHEYLYQGERISDEKAPNRNYYDKLSSFLGDTRIKKVKLEVGSAIPETKHEVMMMRKLCGVQRENFSSKKVCINDFLADFNGCVIDQKYAYLFVGGADELHILSRDRHTLFNTDFLEKVPIMLEIIDLFIGLHKIKYVHSNIRSENIMSSIDTRNFKIVGLQFTDLEGKPILGGIKENLAPERRLKDSTAKVLTVQEDIYSLAMTLAKLEGYYESDKDFLSEECLESMKALEGCRKNFEKAIEDIFPEKRKLSFLIPIFKKALSFSTENRYKTMEEFSFDILSEFSKIVGAKKSVEAELNFRLKYYPKGKSFDYWKCKSLTMNFSTSVFRGISTDKIKNEDYQKLCDEKNKKAVAANQNTKQLI